MARYTTKYGIGQNVEVQGIPGQITAVTLRKGHRAYEFSYVKDGGPTSCMCEEVEISNGNNNSLGFKRQGDDYASTHKERTKEE